MIVICKYYDCYYRKSRACKGAPKITKVKYGGYKWPCVNEVHEFAVWEVFKYADTEKSSLLAMRYLRECNK